jgi:uncharacterized OsmC-like protein
MENVILAISTSRLISRKSSRWKRNREIPRGGAMGLTHIDDSPGLADAVSKIRAHLSSVPKEKATVTFRAATRLDRGLTTRARIRKFNLTIDEPVEMGGGNEGPNPVEVFLAAFGTCQEIVYGVYAAARGIRLERLEIDVEGDLDPRGFFGVADVTPGLSALRFRVRIESPEAPERIAELVDLVSRRCPVLDMLQRPVPISGTVDLNGRSLGLSTT